MENLRVIFHLDEMDKWNLTVKNIKNFYRQAPGSKIIVLANAEAVLGLKKNSDCEGELNLMMGEGIRFLACKNAIRELKVDEKELIKSVELVESGVVALVEWQNQGYSYIRP